MTTAERLFWTLQWKNSRILCGLVVVGPVVTDVVTIAHLLHCLTCSVSLNITTSSLLLQKDRGEWYKYCALCSCLQVFYYFWYFCPSVKGGKILTDVHMRMWRVAHAAVPPSLRSRGHKQIEIVVSRIVKRSFIYKQWRL